MASRKVSISRRICSFTDPILLTKKKKNNITFFFQFIVFYNMLVTFSFPLSSFFFAFVITIHLEHYLDCFEHLSDAFTFFLIARDEFTVMWREVLVLNNKFWESTSNMPKSKKLALFSQKNRVGSGLSKKFNKIKTYWKNQIIFSGDSLPENAAKTLTERQQSSLKFETIKN